MNNLPVRAPPSVKFNGNVLDNGTISHRYRKLYPATCRDVDNQDCLPHTQVNIVVLPIDSQAQSIMKLSHNGQMRLSHSK